MPSHPDRQTGIPGGQHDADTPPVGRSKHWSIAGKNIDLLGRGGGYQLVPLSSDQARSIPQALIQNIRGIPCTFASIVRQLEGDIHGQHRKEPGADNNGKGEPISGVIPISFLDAYKKSLVIKGHKAPYAQFLGSRLQAIASQTRGRDKSQDDCNRLLSQADLLILNPPILSEIGKTGSLKPTDLAEPEARHSIVALKDPVGHILSTIKSLADNIGVPLEIDALTAKRFEQVRGVHVNRPAKRKPLINP